MTSEVWTWGRAIASRLACVSNTFFVAAFKLVQDRLSCQMNVCEDKKHCQLLQHSEPVNA